MSSIQVQGSSSGAGTITVVAPITANNRILTLPDQNGTLLTSAGSTITNTTNASSTTTGALQVAGGVGIGGDLVVGSNLKLTTAGAVVQNSSGNPILRQSGSVLKVQQFTDAGSTTTAGSFVNLNSSAFNYTPVSTNSTLYLTISAYTYNVPTGGYPSGNCYSFYAIGEYISGVWTAISNTGYLWNYQYSSTYAQSIGIQSNMTCTRSNSSLTVRQFDLMGAVTNLNMPFYCTQIILTVMEVAN